MKPETGLFLRKAYEFLDKAEKLLNENLWPEEVGRAACLAGFHAAQGILFETAGKVFKTNKGVQSEFGRLVTDDSQFDPELRGFLGRTYNLKAAADYEIDPGVRVTAAQAAEAVAGAKSFVTRLANSLGEKAI